MVRFDEVLDKMGHFGLSQIFIFLMLSYYRAFSAFHSLATVFIAYEPEFRCDFNVTLFGNQSETDLLDGLVPYDHLNNHYSTCYHFPYKEENCNGSLACVDKTFDPIPCGNLGYEYDTSLFTQTVITEFDLVCDDYYLNTIATSIYQVGNFMGSILFGNFADRYGRKVTCVMTFALALASSFALSLSRSTACYVIFRALTAVFAYGTAIGTYVYVTEIVGSKYRAYVGVAYHMFYPIGIVFETVIAYYWRDWHHLMLICSVVSVPLLFFCMIVPESPRWLLSTGKINKCKKVVQRMSRLNGKKLSDEELEEMFARNSDDNHEKADETDAAKEKKTRKRYTSFDLFKLPNMRMMTLNVMFQWFVSNLIFYGISLDTESLGGNIFVNNCLNGAMELLAYIFSMTLVERVGRKFSLRGGISLASFGLLSSCLVRELSAHSQGLHTLSVALAMVGKIGSSICNAAIYTVTVELFPTLLRSNGLGIGSASSRVGGTLSPFVIALHNYVTWLPNLIFGALGAVAAVAATKLPETKGCEMLDDLEQAERFLASSMKKKQQITDEDSVINL